ncbi:hypothetical protein ACSQ9S_22940, partial [Salmonella enterica]|uniref:hypothetical protein n=1 Tax=Salmonella enterica TaxID=28901 RepID=UPI003EDC9C6C
AFSENFLPSRNDVIKVQRQSGSHKWKLIRDKLSNTMVLCLLIIKPQFFRTEKSNATNYKPITAVQEPR